ncbi:MAG: non-ribosomal peptide synthetase, partial [Tumebacillaceae bacterium]
PLTELPVQYADYAVWQREWLQGEVLESQLAYWKQQLAGELPMLELPTDRPRPAVASHRGAVHRFVLPRELTEDLRAMCQREGVTLYMLLLAAFQTLLHRYTGQDDILVGSPTANRAARETEGLIGFFVNMLVMRTDFSGELTFRELLGQVRDVALSALANQDVPFEKLVEELQTDRDMSYSPLFQVLFQVHQEEAFRLHGLNVENLEVTNGTAKTDLSLPIFEVCDELVGRLEYSTDLFDEGTIAAMVVHFQTLLAAIVERPEEKIALLPPMTSAELEQVLVEWNDTATEYPETTIHRLFEEQVEANADVVALVFGEEQLTYRELNERANQVARHLQTRGVGQETVVGICMERSLELIIGLLGTLKAGGTYLPLDPSYPQERLAMVLEDADPKVLLMQAHLVERLPAHEVPVVCLDREWAVMAQESVENVEGDSSVVSPDQLSNLIFTSGSTGRPKGVCLTHRGVARLVKNNRYLQVTPEHVFIQNASIGFDVSTFEIWSALCNGAKLVMAPPHQLSLEELGELLVEYQVTTALFTTALFNQLVEHHHENMQSLRYLGTGGEAVSHTHIVMGARRLPNCRIVNLYGPTEGTCFATYYPVPAPDEIPSPVPIGKPLSNTTCYVLDRHLQAVPVGVVGELYIGGPGLARGYLGRDDLTEAAFIQHPFSSDSGARLYKTGDRVRYLPDGNLEFLGRTDDLVKIRGFRIELSEIETVLTRHEAVERAVLVVHGEQANDKRLVAYVVPAQGQSLTAEQVKAHVQQSLPSYMVPSFFMLMESLPITRNGKVDKRALPAPSFDLENVYVAARNETEEVIASIWSSVLGMAQVGVHDNFFSLGGHSLLVTQVISRLRATCHVELKVADLFAAPTVAELAQMVQSLQKATPEAAGVAMLSLGKTVLDGEAELSFAQQRLWFFDQFTPKSSLYNVPTLLRIKGQLQVEALEESLNAIVRRHDVLRTAFAEVTVGDEDRQVQRIAAELHVPLHMVELVQTNAE